MPVRFRPSAPLKRQVSEKIRTWCFNFLIVKILQIFKSKILKNGEVFYIKIGYKNIEEKYKITCKHCKQEFYRQRLSKNFIRKYRCAKCGSAFEVNVLV